MTKENQKENITEAIETEKNLPKKKRSKKMVFALILAGVVVGLASFGLVRKISIAGQLFVAQRLVRQGNCAEAVPKLHQIIYADPENAEAYYQRAICYYSKQTTVFDRRYRNLVEAIYDMNAVIMLRPDIGDHYVDRELVFRELAKTVGDSATRFKFYELALQDCEKAMSLGVSDGYKYVYRHYARNMIEANHCQEGLEEILALIAQTDSQDSIMSTYNIYLTEAHICLEDFEKALESVQQVECDDPVSTCRSGMTAKIYFQMGEKEKALEILNDMILEQPVSGGWRYFLRAAIYYEKGQDELALQDMALGEQYTWFGDGVYWRTRSQMAFDEDDDKNGVLYLQYAESTSDIQYTTFRKEIQEELESLGSTPLNLEPTIPANIEVAP